MRDRAKAAQRSTPERPAYHCPRSIPPSGTVRITSLLTNLKADELPRAIERAAELGVERILVKVNDGSADQVLPWLDRLAAYLPICRH